MRIEVQGNTPEWLQHRHGCATGSKLIKAVKKLLRASGERKKGDYSERRDKYAREIICERLGGLAIENFVTPFMQQGLDNEGLAIEAYSLKFDIEIERKWGFALHPSIEWFGASLDGTVADNGGVEAKCFIPDKHIEIYESGEMPEENIPQVLCEIACYELEWVDWISYCGFGQFPREVRLFRKRIARTDYLKYNDVIQTVDSHIADIEAEAKKFLEDVALRMGKLAERSLEMSLAE